MAKRLNNSHKLKLQYDTHILQGLKLNTNYAKGRAGRGAETSYTADGNVKQQSYFGNSLAVS